MILELLKHSFIADLLVGFLSVFQFFLFFSSLFLSCSRKAYCRLKPERKLSDFLCVHPIFTCVHGDMVAVHQASFPGMKSFPLLSFANTIGLEYLVQGFFTSRSNPYS